MKTIKSYNKQKTNPNMENIHEYSVKYSNFHPMKNSPNLFMTKLEMRIKQYYLDFQLSKDVLSLETK